MMDRWVRVQRPSSDLHPASKFQAIAVIFSRFVYISRLPSTRHRCIDETHAGTHSIASTKFHSHASWPLEWSITFALHSSTLYVAHLRLHQLWTTNEIVVVLVYRYWKWPYLAGRCCTRISWMLFALTYFSSILWPVMYQESDNFEIIIQIFFCLRKQDFALQLSYWNFY